jgi:hypothetical protein
VPPFSAVSGGEAATIEYAVAELKVKDMIICGHSLCNAMATLLHPGHLDGFSAVNNLLTYAQATGRIIEDDYGHITDKASRLTVTVEENVLVQVENLRTLPGVAAAGSRGDLKLHGWTYELETGQGFSYDPTEGQFLAISVVPVLYCRRIAKHIGHPHVDYMKTLVEQCDIGGRFVAEEFTMPNPGDTRRWFFGRHHQNGLCIHLEVVTSKPLPLGWLAGEFDGNTGGLQHQNKRKYRYPGKRLQFGTAEPHEMLFTQ